MIFFTMLKYIFHIRLVILCTYYVDLFSYKNISDLDSIITLYFQLFYFIIGFIHLFNYFKLTCSLLSLFIHWEHYKTLQSDRNFLQSTYKNDKCHLNMWETLVFLLMLLKKHVLLMLLKKHVRSTCYLNNMCFLHAKGYISILYVGCRKFPTN
jgi:hypothetical protein